MKKGSRKVKGCISQDFSGYYVALMFPSPFDIGSLFSEGYIKKGNAKRAAEKFATDWGFTIEWEEEG